MTFDQWVIIRLRAHGFYAGVVDGVPGREMIEGLKRFQAAEGLKSTGLADEATVNALRRDKDGGGRSASVIAMPGKSIPIPAEPIWMREARRLMGIAEVPGPQSNPVIIGWAKALGGWVASWYKNDDTAWCGLFVANVIATTLPSEALPANPLGALNWSKFGRELKIPEPGAILTFVRPGGGHVGLYVGEDATHLHVLGGNQNNSVTITRIERGRLQAVRWPKTVEPTMRGRVVLTTAGVPVSSNEA
ncbi:TIGR02594 family protein [Rhizobium sp. RU35A]|uniref:NlpC/P60 family protein n=1 Tax=Rhizobium sp. RU35A TaxID=1907414 RepID=UPI0009558C9D|nr:TIGR02594 family protein [Rhizobium sp. RU35A]SIP88889.1 TIGR02594 family protein [Rhizobium sp. RU35A]